MLSAIESRLFFFSCEFLWIALSLHENFLEDESGYSEEIGFFFLEKWSTMYESMASWALEARFFPFEIENLPIEQQKIQLKVKDPKVDTLMFNWKDKIINAANQAHTKYVDIKAPAWQYYYYCQFLFHTIQEFENTIIEFNEHSPYRDYFKNGSYLFHNLSAYLQQERPLYLKETDMKAANLALDTFAIQLGKEWRDEVSIMAYSKN